MEVDAPAKVNLFLRVLRREPSGYHVIETLFQAISLHDTLTLTLTGGGVRLRVDGPDLGPAERNLAVRAARAFLGTAGCSQGVEIRLTKRIPAGAGLGGGSSDAAAVLRGLSRLHPEAVEPGALVSLARDLGADVPFFLGARPLARGTGHGDVLTVLEPLPPVPLVLVCPPVHVSTPQAYQRLSEARDARGWPDAEERRLPASLGGWDEVNACAHNDFEEIVPLHHPDVARALAALRDTAERRALVSGSGAACFALCTDEDDARRVRDAAARRVPEWPVQVVRTLESFPVALNPPASSG